MFLKDIKIVRENMTRNVRKMANNDSKKYNQPGFFCQNDKTPETEVNSFYDQYANVKTD